LGNRDNVKRIFFLTEDQQVEFLEYLPLFLSRLRLLDSLLSYTWERIYNDPKLSSYFGLFEPGVPVFWNEDVYSIRENVLEEDQIAILNRYCDLNRRFYDMVVRIPLDAVFLRGLVDRSVRRLSRYRNLRSDAVRHEKALSHFSDSGYHKESLFVARTQLQMMHVSFRVFPGDVPRILEDRSVVGKCVTSCTSELFQGAFPLVNGFARKYCRKLSHRGVDYHDLCQEGRLGLMKALYRFDYRRGHRFSTYASYWVRHYMRLYLSANLGPMPVPMNQAQHVKTLAIFLNEFREKHHRKPTDKEIMKSLSWDKSMLSAIHHSSPSGVSFDTPLDTSGSSGVTLGDMMQSNISDPGRVMESEDMRILVLESILELKEDFSIPLLKNMGLTSQGDLCTPMTMEEIASEYGISRQAISQRLDKAKRLLKPMLKSSFSGYFSG
jgi:RNA polymerase sigma factor (sigma-70 family)